eukprot:3033604-Rhodomonas_salina.1
MIQTIVTDKLRSSARIPKETVDRLEKQFKENGPLQPGLILQDATHEAVTNEPPVQVLYVPQQQNSQFTNLARIKEAVRLSANVNSAEIMAFNASLFNESTMFRSFVSELDQFPIPPIVFIFQDTVLVRKRIRDFVQMQRPS